MVVCRFGDSNESKPHLVAVVLLASSTSLPTHKGFVNSVQCDEGTHVSGVMDKIVDAVSKRVLAKNKNLVDRTIRAVIRKSIILVVKALVPDPTFSGVTKAALTLPCSQFTFPIQLEESFVTKLDRWNWHHA